MNPDGRPDFEVRALELHSLYAWDYERVTDVMDRMERLGMNTLVLHRNDIVDEVVYPGKYFGYVPREGDNSIFDDYAQIFRTVYKYTPTRRSGPYQRRAYLKRVLEQAARRGFKVYLENKELYFPEILLELYPHLVKDGHICATDPFWPEFLKEKYRELFRDFPEISGIITSPATGESKVSIRSNRCTCERCRRTTPQQWYRSVLMTMYEAAHAEGKDLVVRDFVFDPQSQAEIAAVMEEMPEDVIIALKNTPHDYYPTFPVNPRIGRVGRHRQWIEFDTMGQYFGWGLGVADLREDFRSRLTDAREKGADGALFRLEWESLDGHSSLHTPNKINIFAAGALTRDLNAAPEEICLRMVREDGWTAPGKSEEAAAGWLSKVLEQTWEITRRTPFIGGSVFSDSSLMPVSLEHALWLAEEKNSLKDWDSSHAADLSPLRASVERAFKEKDEALRHVRALLKEIRERPADIDPEKGRWLEEWFRMSEVYVRMFRLAARLILSARYLLETKEDDPDFRTRMEEVFETGLAEGDRMKEEMAVLHRETDLAAYAVYTLLDPDRMDSLLRHMRALLPKEGEQR